MNLNIIKKYNAIEFICDAYGIKNYFINNDYTVDVFGDVVISNRDLSKMPLKFGIVTGDFDCRNNQLTNLYGSPKEVHGNFYCLNNLITSLDESPIEIGGSFIASKNRISSIKDGPLSIGSHFNIQDNYLTNLNGCTKNIIGEFICDYNPLPTLILNNSKYIKDIVKYQDDYSIWNKGKLNEFRFNDMMAEIEEMSYIPT